MDGKGVVRGSNELMVRIGACRMWVACSGMCPSILTVALHAGLREAAARAVVPPKECPICPNEVVLRNPKSLSSG